MIIKFFSPPSWLGIADCPLRKAIFACFLAAFQTIIITFAYTGFQTSRNICIERRGPKFSSGYNMYVQVVLQYFARASTSLSLSLL